MNIVAIIPAVNEEETVATVVSGFLSREHSTAQLSKIVVVDNGSTDKTSSKAREAGAEVVYEPKMGYGSACLKGIESALDSDVVVFIDADGSDDPTEWVSLVEPILQDKFDFVVGSRVLGDSLNTGLLPHAKFGNLLATRLLSLIYNFRFTDLGPFRAIRTASLLELDMQDRDFGWTVEMQIKALRKGLRICELPVSYQKRLGGESKVAGTLKGSFLAGCKILNLVFKELFRAFLEGASGSR